MIIWHRSGWNGTTPRCRSLNIANSTFSECRLQEILRICRFADRASHPPCKKHCKYHVFMQNAAKRRFWDHTMGGGGGGGSEPRTGIIYIGISTKSGTLKFPVHPCLSPESSQQLRINWNHQAAHHGASVASHFAHRRLPCWAQLLRCFCGANCQHSTTYIPYTIHNVYIYIYIQWLFLVPSIGGIGSIWSPNWQWLQVVYHLPHSYWYIYLYIWIHLVVKFYGKCLGKYTMLWMVRVWFHAGTAT